MNLESLIAEAARRADERFDEVLVRILTSDIPEVSFPANCCRKCGPLLTDYIRYKIALHRWGRRHDDWYYSTRHSPAEENGILLRMGVERTKIAFHAASCECGLQLWRGRRWRECQGPAHVSM